MKISALPFIDLPQETDGLLVISGGASKKTNLIGIAKSLPSKISQQLTQTAVVGTPISVDIIATKIAASATAIPPTFTLPIGSHGKSKLIICSSLTNASINISAITFVGGIVTCTTSTAHSLVSGDAATVSGVDVVDYNGTYTVTVLNTTQFTFTKVGLVTTPTVFGQVFKAGAAVVTISNGSGISTAKFSTVGASISLQNVDGQWFVTSSHNVSIS